MDGSGDGVIVETGLVVRTLAAADANDDGTLDVSDGLFTVTRLFGGSDLEAPLPPVADTCVIDASSDGLPDCSYPFDSCGS